MIYIDKCRHSMNEVKDYMDKKNKPLYMTRLVEVRVDSNDFNNGTSRNYAFCHTIKHPETGETLYPVKGYVGPKELQPNKDVCYYAEYVSKKGEYYSYSHKFDLFDKENNYVIREISVNAQHIKDGKTYENKFCKAEEAGQMGE